MMAADLFKGYMFFFLTSIEGKKNNNSNIFLGTKYKMAHVYVQGWIIGFKNKELKG